MPYVNVYVELDEFDDQDLIDELESRDWWVSPEKYWEPEEVLSDAEKDWICETIIGLDLESQDPVAREIYGKLRKPSKVGG